MSAAKAVFTLVMVAVLTWLPPGLGAPGRVFSEYTSRSRSHWIYSKETAKQEDSNLTEKENNMLRRTLLASLTILTIASKAASWDYERIETHNYVVENRSGTVTMTAQTLTCKRIYAFIVKHRTKLEQRTALEFCMACSQTYDPKTCAAIAAAESNFTSGAIGRDGEVSALDSAASST